MLPPLPHAPPPPAVRTRPGTFDLLVYADAEVQVPGAWEESAPKLIANQEEVKLRSFTTQIHKVDTMVAYKAD